MTRPPRQRHSTPNTRSAAAEYLERRWKVAPIRRGRKDCRVPSWQVKTFNVTDFRDDDNIGVQFGSVSNGLCDIDLDCAEARMLAPLFLPATEAVFGRASSPGSHWLYVSDLWRTAKRASTLYADPMPAAEGQEQRACLVELRTGRVDKRQRPVGAISMLPPSLHPSGEQVRWERDGEPARVDGRELTRAAGILSAATLLVRHYPPEGRRHEAALVLGGWLARAGWSEQDIAAFASAVAQTAQDAESEERARSAAGAVQAMQAGTDVAGMPRLREVWGERIADAIAPWLGIEVMCIAPTASLDQRIAGRIAELARLSNVDYDRARDDAAKQLRIRKSTLDAEVERQRADQTRQAAQRPAPDLGELAALSAEIIASEDVLTLFAQDIGRYIAGETKNAKLLYLVGTSRLFAKGMHAAIKGPSSGGKSELRTRVLEYFPPEDVISFTSMSERALLFMAEDLQHRILSMGEAISGEELKLQDYLLRELMSEGVLRYPIATKVGGHITTTVIEKHGPVSFMVTTTRNKLHQENETRMLSLEVDDGEAQTRAVMAKVAESEGYSVAPRSDDLEPWRNYQRFLAAGSREVIIPFARTLVRLIPPSAVRLRRDVGQLLRAIKVHALLHRQHRPRDNNGPTVARIDEDYAPVRSLMGDLIATTAQVKVRKAVVATIEAVEARQPENLHHGVSAREVADELHLDRTAAWRRLKQAEDAGYVVNVEERRGHPGQYRTTNESEAMPDADMLPTVEQLKEALERRRQRPSQESPENRPQRRNRAG